MLVRLTQLGALAYRAWNLLDLPHAGGGPPEWKPSVGRLLLHIDAAVGQLSDLAARRRAAVVLVGPTGACPFQGTVNICRQLAQRGLLHAARGAARWRYRQGRLLHKIARSVLGSRGPRPLAARLGTALPVDWRRSAAVSFNGLHAGLVYLNTPARFGRGPLSTPRLREQALAEVLAALAEARDPESQQALFPLVYETSRGGGIDPLQRQWPDVVAVPAAGYHLVHRLDGAPRLVGAQPEILATRSGQSLLAISGPSVAGGATYTAALCDVAPTIMALLGLAPPSAGGRVLPPVLHLFDGDRPHQAARADYVAAATRLRSTPSRSISTSTTSPGLRNTGGVRAMPTPGGVPVKITSPGSSVDTCET